MYQNKKDIIIQIAFCIAILSIGISVYKYVLIKPFRTGSWQYYANGQSVASIHVYDQPEAVTFFKKVAYIKHSDAQDIHNKSIYWKGAFFHKEHSQEFEFTQWHSISFLNSMLTVHPLLIDTSLLEQTCTLISKDDTDEIDLIQLHVEAFDFFDVAKIPSNSRCHSVQWPDGSNEFGLIGYDSYEFVRPNKFKPYSSSSSFAVQFRLQLGDDGSLYEFTRGFSAPSFVTAFLAQDNELICFVPNSEKVVYMFELDGLKSESKVVRIKSYDEADKTISLQGKFAGTDGASVFSWASFPDFELYSVSISSGKETTMPTKKVLHPHDMRFEMFIPE